jgi:hypothetical protein
VRRRRGHDRPPGRPSVDLRALADALRSDPDGARELVSALAPLIFGAAVTATTPAGEWSSRKGHGPPGYAQKTWRTLTRRIGVKRGRWWYVSNAALEAHERGEGPSANERVELDQDAGEPWDPYKAIREAGIRLAVRK